jgi:hypothetical protein
MSRLVAGPTRCNVGVLGRSAPHLKGQRVTLCACDQGFPLNRVGGGADGRKARAYGNNHQPCRDYRPPSPAPPAAPRAACTPHSLRRASRSGPRSRHTCTGGPRWCVNITTRGASRQQMHKQ